MLSVCLCEEYYGAMVDDMNGMGGIHRTVLRSGTRTALPTDLAEYPDVSIARARVAKLIDTMVTPV